MIFQVYICVFRNDEKFAERHGRKNINIFKSKKDKDLDDMYSVQNVSGLEIGAVPWTTAF